MQKGSVFQDPSGKYNGVLWFFEGEVKDGKGQIAGKRLITIYDNGKELTDINPAILWDFIASDNNKQTKVNIDKEKAQEHSISAVEKYKQEIVKERKRQAEIKKKYGIKSLEYFIGKLDADLAELYERQAEGEKVDIVIRNKGEKKKQYEESLKTLQKEIEQEISLTVSMPKFLGAVLIQPEISEISKKAGMVSDEEVEKIGMKISMEYEKKQGRKPIDVSKENLGFDIRSKGDDEIRYIEVKARANEGYVALTTNEWFKANRFKEQYWLYIISNAVTNPSLYIINNPFKNLNAQEKIEVVRFIVPLEEWKGKGVKVEND